MPDPAIPVSNPPVPGSIGIQALNLRTSTGLEQLPNNGGLKAPGIVSVGFTPCYWDAVDSDRYAGQAGLSSTEISDVSAWLTERIGGGDPLGLPAAQKLAEVQANLLWLVRYRLSLDGLCPAPVV